MTAGVEEGRGTREGGVVWECPRAAVTMTTHCTAEDNRNVFSHRPKGGGAPSAGSEGESIPCPAPSFWRPLAISGIAWFVDTLLWSLPLSSHGLLSFVFLYLWLFSFYKDICPQI